MLLAVTVWQIFYSYLLVSLIGLAVFPLTSFVFPRFRDRGWGFSKILGWGFVSWVMWLLGSLKMVPFSTVILVSILLGVVGGCWLLLKKRMSRSCLATSPDWLKVVLIQEGIFFALFVVLCLIRSFYPELMSVEKPMDFAFINSIVRSRFFPPTDPWLAGEVINYYYFGHIMVAVLVKLSGFSASVIFNLASILIVVLAGQGLFSLAHTLSGRLGVGWLAAFFGVLAGNLHLVLRGWWDVDPTTGEYFYPRATRIVPYTINEFPAYSLVLGDLHAHVLGLPVFVLGLGLLAAWWFTGASSKKGLFISLVFGLVLGWCLMTNSWDAPSLWMLYGCLILTKLLTERKHFVTLVLGGFGTLIGLLVSSGLFLVDFSAPVSGIGWVHTRSPFDFYMVFFGGQFILLTIFLIIWLLYPKGKAFSLGRFRVPTPDRQLLLVLIVSLFSLGLMLVPEVVYLKDIFDYANPNYYRTNTVFKIHFQVWVLLSLVGVVLFWQALRWVRCFPLKATLFLVLTFLIFSQGLYTVVAFDDASHSYALFQGLDGAAVLAHDDPSDYQAIRWLQGNVRGQPVILEAVGLSYTRYARVSSWTGLPTVVGWVFHQWQWRGKYEPYRYRESVVRQIYEGDDTSEVVRLLKEFNVSYVYIGDLERERYSALNQDLLKTLGRIVYNRDDTLIVEIL